MDLDKTIPGNENGLTEDTQNTNHTSSINKEAKIYTQNHFRPRRYITRTTRIC